MTERNLAGVTAIALLLIAAQARAQGPPVLVTAGLSFRGSSFGADSAFVPADANGAVGRGYFVEFVNGHFAVYSKTNGSRVASKSHRDFWQESGLPFAALEAVDPRTVYDASVERYYVSSVEVDPVNLTSNRLLLAVSATSDPTGRWHGFGLPGPVGRFADFATLGHDQAAVYLAGYIVTGSDGLRGTNVLMRVPKQDLLAPTPRVDRTTILPLLPGPAHGNILQPAVSLDGIGTGTVLAAGSLGWDQREHTNLVGFRLAQSASSTNWDLSPVDIRVPAYSMPMNGVQPDGSDLLSLGDTRLSATVHELNGVIYAVHSTEHAGRSAVRWYRIRATDLVLLETGTVSDPELDLYYPSIAANRAGVVVIGFNGSGPSSFITSYAMAGRIEEGVTTFGSRILLKAGLDAYTYLSPSSGNFRWGDYSATTVDPEDPFRFWTIQLYPFSSDAWSAQITELRTGLPELSVSRVAENAVLSWYGSRGMFGVETSANLEPPGWEALNGAVAVDADGLHSVSVAADEAQRFFRLRSQ